MHLHAAARVLRGLIPEPFVLALLLTVMAFLGAAGMRLAEGQLDLLALAEAWVQGSPLGEDPARVGGLWSLLGFSMQMCLILVTGYAVAGTPMVQAALRWVAAWARGPRVAVVLVAAVSMGLGLIHWGLGLISGALLAREIGHRLSAQGTAVHYPALAAAGYTGLAVWHGGLSGTAPLKVTNLPDLIEVVGADLAARTAEIPLTATVLSPRNLLVSAMLFLVIPAVLLALVPRDPERFTPPPPMEPTSRPEPAEEGPAGWLDHSPWLGGVVALVVLLWFFPWFLEGGAASLSPDHLNLFFFSAGLLLAGSPARYMHLAAEGARACAGIIVQFPLYGGILGLLIAGGLLERFAAALPGDPLGLSLATFLGAGIINLFVPSGGGQWAVQGPVLLQAAADAGLDPGRIVLAMAYGDQWTNLFQPFWALPLLGITGAKAGDLLGNTVVVGVVVGLVLAVAVALPSELFWVW
ncbi:MAG: short-chain fatty acid transporter [Deltaproteobacteria bacterium]|nr:MAG: short-chain fatty acid transporter [Deltaproteobacteria bacterium]